VTAVIVQTPRQPNHWPARTDHALLHSHIVPGLAAITATALVLWAGLPASAAPAAMTDVSHTAHATTVPSVEKRITFRNAMGKYWEDHITWTRLFIISDLADSPDLPMTTQRLLQNQVDIGNAIKPYYGDAAGDQLTGLLRDHILIAADVVAAAKAGDTASLNDQMARWQANADEIGSLSGSDKRQIGSRLVVLLLHLLKRTYQSERATRSWQLTQIEQAGAIAAARASRASPPSARKPTR